MHPLDYYKAHGFLEAAKVINSLIWEHGSVEALGRAIRLAEEDLKNYPTKFKSHPKA